MFTKQHTLKAPVSFEGIGLHTGKKVKVIFCPAPENHGYKFKRIDLEDQPIIPADADLVTDTKRGTTLEKNGVFLPENMSIEFQKQNTDRPRIVVFEQKPGSKFKLRVFYLQLVMMAGR